MPENILVEKNILFFMPTTFVDGAEYILLRVATICIGMKYI
jgi:hypothetical protein